MTAKLTDARIKSIKPDGKTHKILDGHGLYIHLTPAGSKLWRLAYTFDGKQKTLALGKYPETSLQAARKKAEEARELRAAGIDPGVERKEEKARAQKEAEIAARTFAAVACEWIEVKKSAWSAGNLKKKLRLIEIFNAHIGGKPISLLTPSDILEVIRPYDNIGKTETAHILAQTASQICGYARICDYAQYDAGAGLTRALKPVETKHRPCLLNPADVGRLLLQIDEFQGSISVLFALKILPYVSLRSTELRGRHGMSLISTRHSGLCRRRASPAKRMAEA